MKHKLFVVNHQAAMRANTLTFVIHNGDGLIPFREAVSVATQIEARDSDFSSDDRVHCCPPVTDH